MIRHLIQNFGVKKSSNTITINSIYLNRFSTIHNKTDSKISANINIENEAVLIQVKNFSEATKKFKFPFVWLRDNCMCEKCHHKASSSRIINWENFDVAIKPKNVVFDNQKNILRVEWDEDNNHISEYEYDWLNKRNFTKDNRVKYLNKYYRPSKTLLNKADFENKLEYFDYEEIINNDLDLFKWLHSLITYGITIIKNVPESENEVRKLANRVAFIRRTHYGEEFIVKAKDGTSNVAYLSENLQMHTDLPYYDYAPGVNLLHCLVQSKSNGAQNLLTDGFNIAEKMRREYPEEFKALSTIVVNWSDIGHEDNNHFHSIYRAPMFCLDYDGNMNRINHSIPQRDSFFSVSTEQVQSWYKALSKFINLIHKEAFEFKTKEGTILCFDNSRLIHGRKKYEDSTENRRHIIGAYLDWDELFSRYRVLQNKFEI